MTEQEMLQNIHWVCEHKFDRQCVDQLTGKQCPAFVFCDAAPISNKIKKMYDCLVEAGYILEFKED